MVDGSSFVVGPSLCMLAGKMTLTLFVAVAHINSPNLVSPFWRCHLLWSPLRLDPNAARDASCWSRLSQSKIADTRVLYFLFCVIQAHIFLSVLRRTSNHVWSCAHVNSIAGRHAEIQ